MKVILISGKAGAGKDTLARILQHQLQNDGATVLITHFGDLLKYIATTFFQWDGLKDKKGRDLLQYLGNDIFRKYDPNFWVSFIVQILKIFQNKWDYVLIPDTRYPNEISVLKEAGFDVFHIRVTRSEEGRNVHPMTRLQQSHPSEIALDDVPPDYSILNDCDIHTLETACGKIRFVMEKRKEMETKDENH